MTESPSDPLAFDPVPSATQRRDGWTDSRQRRFIAALAASGIVARAAQSVGMSRKTAYDLLKRAGPDSGFARAWREAKRIGRRRRRSPASGAASSKPKSAASRTASRFRRRRAAPRRRETAKRGEGVSSRTAAS